MVEKRSFRQRVISGEHLVGTFVKTPADAPIEILGELGFDFVVLDAEHGPFDRNAVDRAIVATRAAGLAALVRLHSGSPHDIQSVLDSGAQGILVPHVTSAARAREIIDSCRYRGGHRGFSTSPRAGRYGLRGLAEHIEYSDQNVTVVVQIEDPEALEELDAIAAVDGVDALFIGRGDLTVAFGATSSAAPQVLDATHRVVAAAKKAGKPFSVFNGNAKDGAEMAALGASLFVAASDQSFMAETARNTLKAFRAFPGAYRGPIYDAHAHLISDDLIRYPRTKPFLEGDVPTNYFGPGTVGKPGGMHGPSPANEKPTAEQMHNWMAEQNVLGIAAVQKGMIYGTDNSYIVDAADVYPDQMRAIIIVDPQAPETPQMVRDYARRGIIGIRFFGVGVRDKKSWLSSPSALEVWSLANDLGLLVDIEAPAGGSYDLIPVVEQMADRFPNLRIVLDHLFLPDIGDENFGIDARFDGFKARNNITYKFTSLNMDYIRENGFAPEHVLRRAVDFYGADKVMWGSDIGTSSGTYAEMIGRAKESTKLLTEAERRKVLHDTGRRVFLGWRGE